MIERRAWSIRLRMTLLTTIITALVSGVVAILVMVATHGRADDYRREKTISAALRLVHDVKRGTLPAVLPHEREAPVLQVLDSRGRIVAASRQVRGGPRVASFVPPEASVYSSTRLCPPRGLQRCMNVVAFRVYQPDGDWIVYAASNTVPWYVSVELVLFVVGLALLLIGLTALSTWRTVNRTLAPVGAIRAELAEITATSSGRRVPVPATRDEIRMLAETVNATLDRLDVALEKQRRFTSDASHDLRSPIAAARAQVEEALIAPEEADWENVGHAVLNSLERLQAIVTDLLELARLDAGTRSHDEVVDLAALVSIELGRVERSKEVVPDLQVETTVRGERLRLTRLLTNLLDNAERHAESRIEVRVRTEGDTAVLEVVDDGAGIAPEDREVVFQRFARLKDSRERDAGGTGLGLPIALQVARAHGGTLSIEDSEKGARFVLRLPRAARA
ncbi:sensor histidine kinase [Actinomadura atramentaria]|uniref:sensor histidine kinase n=1 Tax=Actinomadura atramentaria TaxID=1990 RepID=UPI00039EE710|nr:HAMP domain-containing sensor histidine kinase [Actinomadura atramentaria]